ncbi:hypothetical protein DFH28DRAFT_936104 [Melampsora americana]|nr:hypothetical protein DFH28DRAFT_936104 [Melampsora americana]
MSSSSDIVILPVSTESLVNIVFDISIDYTIWIRKTKSGKQSGKPIWELTEPSKKLNVLLTGASTTSLKSAKIQVFSEIKKISDKTLTLLCAAEDGKSDSENPGLAHKKKRQASESTGGDSNTDAIKIVTGDIYKRHPIRTNYCTSTPVYVDSSNTDRFFYITADMARTWAKEKLKCDDKGTKVVTVDVPPKVSSIYWKQLTTEKSKRLKGSSGDSNLQDVALMLKQVIGSSSQPPSNTPQSDLGPALKAPMSDYLRYCIDQYSLFHPDHLPHQDLKELKLSIGTIARLYMNVKGFSKKLDEERVQ